ncbi:MAG: glycosyltransferase family 39 protein [Bacteroidetes bacterium]|nr:glycosyltransferase family 39 protein [Bacteroidota bacterium]
MATAKTKDKKAITESVPFYKRHWIPLIIFAFAFLLYSNTIGNDYNLDDELVTRNHKITSKGISAIPEIFTAPYYSDDMGYSYDYRPIVHLSFAIEHQFFGESPHVSHFFNTLLFALLCVLLYRLLKALLPIPDIITTTAVLLFAAHPIHTEVVASIKNRDELLMFLFSALSLWVLVKYFDTNPVAALLFSIISFIVALLSKSTAIPFAFLIPVTYIFFRSLPFTKYLLYTCLVSLSAAYFMNNTSLVFKLMIFLLLFVGNVLVYAVLAAIRSSYTFQSIKERLQNTATAKTAFSNNSETYSISFALPKGSVVLWVTLMYITIAIGIYGLFFNLVWLPRLAILACVLFIALSKSRTNIWLIVPLAVFSALFIQKFDASGNQSSSILYLSLVPFYFLLDKKSRWVALILIVLYIINQRIISSSLFFISSAVFLVLLLEEKKRKKALLIGGVVLGLIYGSVLAYNLINGQYRPQMITYWLCTIGAIIWYYQNRSQLRLFQILSSIAIVILVIETFMPLSYSNSKFSAFNLERSFKYNNIYNNTRNTVNLQNVTVPGPVSVSVDRPLNYIETPVPLSAPLKERVLLALDVFLRYAKLLIVPHPLLYYYGYKTIEPVTGINATVVISLLLHISIILAAIYYIKRKPVISWCILFYLAFIITLSNIFISIPGVIGERYLLVPSLAFCILLAYLIIEAAKYLSQQNNRALTTTAKWIVVPILIVYGLATIYRNSLWKDDITLFAHDIKYAPQSAQAHNLLAIHLMQRSFSISDVAAQTDMRKQALGHFQETNRIAPTMFNAAYDIGRAYTTLNMPDSAIIAYKYASTLDSNFYNIQLSIAELYYAQAKYEEAIPYLEYCIRKIPNYYPSYERLSYILFLQKKYRESVAVNKLAIVNIPNTPEPYINIVRTFIGENKIDSARYYALEGYKIAPQNPMAQQMAYELGIITKN